MITMKFKTNLKCNGCINAISPGLQSIPEIKEWNVNLNSPDKELKVISDSDISEKVISAVKKAGYEINRIE